MTNSIPRVFATFLRFCLMVYNNCYLKLSIRMITSSRFAK